MQRKNWDDLRFILAVAEAGTVSGAARLLGVNHATVLRRIAAYELSTGSEVFSKTLKGYGVQPDRQRLIDAVREVETAIGAVDRIMAGARMPLAGDVRITTTDTLATHVMPGIVQEISAKVAGLRLEIVVSNQPVDLARGQADLTIRPAAVLPGELSGVSPARLGFGAYAAKGARHDRWIGLSGRIGASRAGEWLSANVARDRIGIAGDSFLIVRELALLGLGIAILPHMIGAATPALERLDAEMPSLDVPIWVASHADLAEVPRISRMRSLLVDALAERADMLRGPVTA
jgi:DNA-binding transcriptional LysR family regulator